MDLLSFINHLQKKVRSGGANYRVHGIGQGHDSSAADAINTSADKPTDAAVGYMNADMLDGYHAKQVYHGVSPGVYSGLNADQLDGIDKSLGHVASAADFNTSDANVTAATTTITFSGTPKSGDSVILKFYAPDGTQIGADVSTLIPANPTLTIVRDTVKTAIEANLVVSSVISITTSSNSLILTTTLKGAKANLYLVAASITKVAQSSLAIDKSHGVYRFTGGSPAEGINADKLDDFHAREHYHKTGSDSEVVKAPPDNRGINADTLDSFHGREFYHDVSLDKGTGLNADTLDGVHKLHGHSEDSNTNPSELTLYHNAKQPAGNVTLKLELFNALQLDPIATKDFTWTQSDPGDNLFIAIKDEISNLTSPFKTCISPLEDPVTTLQDNKIYFKSKVQIYGERHKLTIRVTITDNSATNKLGISTSSSGPYSQSLVASFTPAAGSSYPVMGVDADMLDSIHANSGHFVTNYLRNISGKLLDRGINSDLLDGLHARVPKNQASTVSTTFNPDGSINTTTSSYVPVADGVLNPRLVSEYITTSANGSNPLWNMFITNQPVTKAPQIAVTDTTDSSSGKEAWAFVIGVATYDPNNSAWTQNTWNNSTPAQKGYLKWWANNTKYLGTSVDHADTASSVNWDNVTSKPAVVYAAVARRLYVYRLSVPYGNRDLFIEIPAAPLMISVRNENITWTSSQGELTSNNRVDTGLDSPVSIDAPPYGTSDQDSGSAITWEPDIDSLQSYWNPDRFGTYKDRNNRVYLVIHSEAFNDNDTLVVSIIV